MINAEKARKIASNVNNSVGLRNKIIKEYYYLKMKLNIAKLIKRESFAGHRSATYNYDSYFWRNHLRSWPNALKEELVNRCVESLRLSGFDVEDYKNFDFIEIRWREDSRKKEKL